MAAVCTDTSGKVHCTGIIPYSLNKYRMSKANDAAMSGLAQATAMYGYYAAQYFSK